MGKGITIHGLDEETRRLNGRQLWVFRETWGGVPLVRLHMEHESRLSQYSAEIFLGADGTRAARRALGEPWASWWYVRSDTHVIDHYYGPCEIKNAGDTARNLAGRLLTPAAVAEAKRTLRNALYSSGRVRAIRVNVYRKRTAR